MQWTYFKKKYTFLVKLQNIQLLSTIIVFTIFFSISYALMTTCDSTQYFVQKNTIVIIFIK